MARNVSKNRSIRPLGAAGHGDLVHCFCLCANTFSCQCSLVPALLLLDTSYLSCPTLLRVNTFSHQHSFFSTRLLALQLVRFRSPCTHGYACVLGTPLQTCIFATPLQTYPCIYVCAQICAHANAHFSPHVFAHMSMHVVLTRSMQVPTHTSVHMFHAHVHAHVCAHVCEHVFPHMYVQVSSRVYAHVCACRCACRFWHMSAHIF